MLFLAWWGLDAEGNFQLAPKTGFFARACASVSARPSSNADTVLEDIEKVILEERRELSLIHDSLRNKNVLIGKSKSLFLLST